MKIQNKIDRSLDFEKSESESGRDREKGKKEIAKEGKRNEKVCMDNDVSELDILGHIGTFWDNSRRLFEELEHLACFPVISSMFTHYGIIKKHVTDGRSDTDRQTLLWRCLEKKD